MGLIRLRVVPHMTPPCMCKYAKQEEGFYFAKNLGFFHEYNEQHPQYFPILVHNLIDYELPEFPWPRILGHYSHFRRAKSIAI